MDKKDLVFLATAIVYANKTERQFGPRSQCCKDYDTETEEFLSWYQFLSCCHDKCK